MKRRLPIKLKKGFRSLLTKRDTKWKRKATYITRKTLEGFTLLLIGPPSNRFRTGGIVYEKPVNGNGEYVNGNGEYVMKKDDFERLIEVIPQSSTFHVTIKHDQLLKSIRKHINER